jgi:hypothetical protein
MGSRLPYLSVLPKRQFGKTLLTQTLIVMFPTDALASAVNSVSPLTATVQILGVGVGHDPKTGHVVLYSGARPGHSQFFNILGAVHQRH